MRLLEAGAASLICQFLEQHLCAGIFLQTEAVEVQEAFCALRGLASASQRVLPSEPLASWWVEADPELKIFVARHAGRSDSSVGARAINLALTALRQPSNNLSQQMELEATCLLLQLARLGPTNRRRITEGGGAELALKALANAGSCHEMLAVEACALVGAILVQGRSVQRQLGVKVRIGKPLLEALARNPTSGPVASEALGALCRLQLESNACKAFVADNLLPDFVNNLEKWGPSAIVSGAQPCSPPPIAEALRLLLQEASAHGLFNQQSNGNLERRMKTLLDEAARVCLDSTIGPGVSPAAPVFGRTVPCLRTVVPADDFPQFGGAVPRRLHWRERTSCQQTAAHVAAERAASGWAKRWQTYLKIK